MPDEPKTTVEQTQAPPGADVGAGQVLTPTQPQGWLAALTSEQKAELTDFAKGIFKADVESLKKELLSARRETSRLRGMGEWDEGKRSRYETDETVRQEAIELYVARGVPEEAFELADTPAKVKRQAEIWLTHQQTDVAVKVEAALAAKTRSTESPRNGAANEKLMPVGVGSGIRTRNVTEDNIDALYLSGEVTDNEYRNFRQGQGLPK